MVYSGLDRECIPWHKDVWESCRCRLHDKDNSGTETPLDQRGVTEYPDDQRPSVHICSRDRRSPENQRVDDNGDILA